MAKDDSNKLFVGTSGFSYPSWKGLFYPEDLPNSKILDYYMQQFNSVEVNSTFYRTPSKKSVENWTKKAPKGFAFTFKGSRYISHVKRLNISKESWHKFYDPLLPVADSRSKHAVLYQLPANLKKDAERLEKLLKDLPKEYRHAFEFRHPTWFDDEIYQVLRKYNTAVVFSDSPIINDQAKWPKVDRETASFFYIRFHGSKELYTSAYTEKELKDYSNMLRKKLDRGLDVYAYFNNDAKGAAPFDAQKLRKKIEGKSVISQSVEMRG